jgi:hypothetical protein
LSAYQLAVIGGFVGDETAWLASLVGPAGADGADGADGAAGADGADGAAATITVGSTGTGAPGSSAAVVNSGTTSAAVLDFTIPRGDTGAAGTAGADGADGLPGVVISATPPGDTDVLWADTATPGGVIYGADGKTILSGTVNPTTEGNDGDFYIRTDTNFIFGPKAAGSWPAGVSLVGPTGAAGADGADGSDGADGLGWTGGSYSAGTGVVTFTSTDGLGFATGDLRGADGADGATGPTGDAGITVAASAPGSPSTNDLWLDIS